MTQPTAYQAVGKQLWWMGSIFLGKTDPLKCGFGITLVVKKGAARVFSMWNVVNINNEYYGKYGQR